MSPTVWAQIAISAGILILGGMVQLALISHLTGRMRGSQDALTEQVRGLVAAVGRLEGFRIEQERDGGTIGERLRMIDKLEVRVENLTISSAQAQEQRDETRRDIDRLQNVVDGHSRSLGNLTSGRVRHNELPG